MLSPDQRFRLPKKVLKTFPESLKPSAIGTTMWGCLYMLGCRRKMGFLLNSKVKRTATAPLFGTSPPLRQRDEVDMITTVPF
jgi:hypothetical protein